jgi:heat shock protein HslJ
VSVWAGCNWLYGQVVTAGGTLVIDGFFRTQQGCGPALAAQDDWLNKVFVERPTWKLDGDVLTITRGSTTLVLQDRKIVESDLPLEGTKWTVESVVSGELLKHFPGVGPAYLTINGNQATGYTGCNTFSSPVTRTGSTLTFGLSTVTTAACTADHTHRERAFLATLNGSLTYTITSNRLELRTPNNKAGLNLISPR